MHPHPLALPPPHTQGVDFGAFYGLLARLSQQHEADIAAAAARAEARAFQLEKENEALRRELGMARAASAVAGRGSTVQFPELPAQLVATCGTGQDLRTTAGGPVPGDAAKGAPKREDLDHIFSLNPEGSSDSTTDGAVGQQPARHPHAPDNLTLALHEDSEEELPNIRAQRLSDQSRAAAASQSERMSVSMGMSSFEGLFFNSRRHGIDKERHRMWKMFDLEEPLEQLPVRDNSKTRWLFGQDQEAKRDGTPSASAKLSQDKAYGEARITGEKLFHVLKSRGSRNGYTPEECASVISELNRISSRLKQQRGAKRGRGLPKPDASTSSLSEIGFKDFAQLMTSQIPPAVIRPDLEDIVLHTQKMIMKRNVSEVIDDLVPSSQQEDAIGASPSRARLERSLSTREMQLNMVVGSAVLLSVFSLACSLDFEPDSAVWTIIEALCALIFVFEACYKLHAKGARALLCGRDFLWEWSDFTITFLAVVDLSLQLFDMNNYFGRYALTFRLLRALRMARLIKLCKAPFMQELSNMLSGFLLGVPSLFWVIFLVLSCYFVLGLLTRMVVGPDPGIGGLRATGQCPPGDFIEEEFPFSGSSIEDEDRWHDDDIPTFDSMGVCKKHILYGEEFFGTIPKSMFTLLRCTFMDCGTRYGQSLVVAFSQGLGIKFDALYTIGMMVIIFGLFNVITAVFVERTMEGLKYDDAKRRFAAISEQAFLREKVWTLTRQMYFVLEKLEDRRASGTAAAAVDAKGSLAHSMSMAMFAGISNEAVCKCLTKKELSKKQFLQLLNDPDVQLMLEDIEINIVSTAGLFELCHVSEKGRVEFPHLIETLMRLRGDLMKSDVVGVVVALGRMHSRLEQIEDLATITNHGLQVTRDRLHSIKHAPARISEAGDSPDDAPEGDDH